MSATKTVKMTLSADSVQEAIEKLTMYKTAVKRAVLTATQRLMEDAQYYLERIVHIEMNPNEQRVTVTSQLTDDGTGFILTMSGAGVGFIEFGTGAYTDTAHPFADNAPFNVYKGSYSTEIGNNTWGAWIQAGLPESEYPYNRYPVRPLYETCEFLRDRFALYFRREFDRIDIS